MRKPATAVVGDGFSALRKEDLLVRNFPYLAVKPGKKFKHLVSLQEESFHP
jgi:hypothetical protein